MKKKNIFGFPKLPKKKRKSGQFPKLTIGVPYFPFYTDYSRATVGAGDNDSPMAQGMSPDAGMADGGGGMGENEDMDKKSLIGNEDELSRSPDEDETVKLKENTPHSYGCISLNVTPAVSSILHYWVRKNIPEECIYINKDTGHDGYEDDFHVTVKYGLNESDPMVISNLLDGYGPVTLKFKDICKFDNKAEYDVIYLSTVSPILNELNKVIESSTDCIKTEQKYIPHLTLAFVKKGSCDTFLNNNFFNMLTDTIDELCFSTKEGDEFFISLKIE